MLTNSHQVHTTYVCVIIYASVEQDHWRQIPTQYISCMTVFALIIYMD